jgi:hypothetical protein
MEACYELTELYTAAKMAGRASRKDYNLIRVCVFPKRTTKAHILVHSVKQIGGLGDRGQKGVLVHVHSFQILTFRQLADFLESDGVTPL